MSAIKFANLHNHTSKGSFDSIIKTKDFVNKIKDLGQEHVVQTDHGTMSGMIELASETQKAGLKYIPGIEFYVTHGAKPTKERDMYHRAFYHMLAIALDNEGLKNLFRLVALSYRGDHFYGKPRISIEELKAHSQGIHLTSGCLASPTNAMLIQTEDYVKAKKTIEDLAFTFKDRFACELQDSGEGENQQKANEGNIQIAKELGIPTVVTSDAHYCDCCNGDLRTIFLKMKSNRDLTFNDKDDEGFFSSGKLWLKSGEELAKIFGDEPVKNAYDIACKSNVNLKLGTPLFPVPLSMQAYIVDAKEKTSEQQLRELTFKGLKTRLEKSSYAQERKDEYTKRLNEELDIICDLGFAPYFLVLFEILDWCRKKNILIGKGRGSAAGSLVSYCLKITGIDPIKYGLYFSRFLNKSRVSPPDIDIDIPKDRRQELIDYLVAEYGDTHVCQIKTFSMLKPKGLARDIARAYGETELGNEIAKLIPPALHGREPTVEESINQVAALREEKYAHIIDKMKELEGVTRQSGVHAAGVIISPMPLSEIAPIEYQRAKGKKTGDRDKPIIQIDMNEVEKLGLIKFDFLGLRNLSTVAEVLEQVYPGVNVNDSFENIDLADPEVFKSIRSITDMGGIFQFENSAAIADLLHSMLPEHLEDISAATSIFRPGPLGQGVDKTFIKNKSQPWTTDISAFDEILKPTNGCLIYQEQLIKLCMDVAGFSEVDGDEVRKVVGKKKLEDVEKWKEPFVLGCMETSKITREHAEQLFTIIVDSASYLFNKSHAVKRITNKI